MSDKYDPSNDVGTDATTCGCLIVALIVLVLASFVVADWAMDISLIARYAIGL